MSPNARRRLLLAVLETVIAAAILTWPSSGQAAHALAEFGEPKYPPGFQHFDYVRPDAPKGGVLNLATIALNSSFDKYNPFSLKGKSAPGLTDLVFETLAVYDLDELHVEYGLLAEDIAVAPDFSSATFRLHAEATFSNGDSVTARDVKYSFDTLNGPKASPRFRSYFTDIDNRGELDPAVFGPMRRQPSTSPPGSYRANLREAARLFAEAGWRNRGDGVLRNDKGEPFVLRVSGSPSLLEAFYLNVKRLGVEVVYRNGDPAVDRENLRNFDFDFTSIALRESRDPGPELLRAFSSQEADVPGSENLLGLKSPAVDFLIGRILDAQSEHDLETAAHAFDRVMVAQAYVLPWRWLKNHYVMYNRRLKRPPTLPLYYGATEWALADWWDGSVEGR